MHSSQPIKLQTFFLCYTKAAIQKCSLIVHKILETNQWSSSFSSKNTGCRSVIMFIFSIMLIFLKINMYFFLKKKYISTLWINKEVWMKKNFRCYLFLPFKSITSLVTQKSKWVILLKHEWSCWKIMLKLKKNNFRLQHSTYLQTHIKGTMPNMSDGITFWVRFNLILIIEYEVIFVWMIVN